MDDAHFESAYARHADTVLRYCRFRARSYAEAEDLAAETFARFLARGSSVSDDRVEGWLLKTASRLVIDTWRRVRREEPVDAVPDFGIADAQPWLDTDVRDAIAALPPLQQRVVYLRVVEDLPFAQVARACGRSEAAVKMANGRALRALAHKLEGGGAHVAPAEE